MLKPLWFIVSGKHSNVEVLSNRNSSCLPSKVNPLSSTSGDTLLTSSLSSATICSSAPQPDTWPSTCWTFSWTAMTSLCSSFTWFHWRVFCWLVCTRMTLCFCEVCPHWCDSKHLCPGKFEEREDRVPKLETLNGLGCMSSMNLVLTKQGLLHMELLLLETFQWNLYLPTAAHYIEYFLSAAVHEGDLHDGWPMTSVEKTKVYMLKYADYFLEVSLQGIFYLVFKSYFSLIAGSQHVQGSFIS